MTISEFLESNEYEDITIHGSYYTISRKGDNNWMVYSHVSLDAPSAEYVSFDDAQNAFVNMERDLVMATQAAKEVRRGGFVINREVE